MRKLYAEVPPRVEYELTALGNSLVPYIESLADWALKIKRLLQNAERCTQSIHSKTKIKLISQKPGLSYSFYCSII
ncbi:hypothetical protein BW716_22085 [[Flexibacter] sp. ATCC 35208]|nr:hypothetical protein BW716_22085 [[Flexibacter] sp. ATCC 35208]